MTISSPTSRLEIGPTRTRRGRLSTHDSDELVEGPAPLIPEYTAEIVVHHQDSGLRPSTVVEDHSAPVALPDEDQPAPVEDLHLLVLRLEMVVPSAVAE